MTYRAEFADEVLLKVAFDLDHDALRPLLADAADSVAAGTEAVPEPPR